jgi:hypothetical protein
MNSKKLYNFINIDLNTNDLRSICTELRDEQLAVETSNHVLTLLNEIINDLQTENNKHHWTLKALKTALDQLKTGVDRNIVISDIEQYMKDLGT